MPVVYFTEIFDSLVKMSAGLIYHWGSVSGLESLFCFDVWRL